MKDVKQLIGLIIFISLTQNLLGQPRSKDYYWGVKAGAVFPTNLGRSDDEIGFKDVASTGFISGLTAGWNYNERLSLAAELNYQYLPKKESFWNVESKGTFSANYQSSSLLITGNYHFSSEGWRPYCGVNFGMHYLRNRIDFNSKYNGTDNDASIDYTATEWHPGFGCQFGTMVELTKNTQLVLETRLSIIPYLKEKMVPIMDGDLVTDYFTKNPHGNQNQLSITIGINFSM